MCDLRRTPLRRMLVPLVLMAWLSGCYRYEHYDPGSTDVEDGLPEAAVLVLRSGDEIDVTGPAVRGDTIYAHPSGAPPYGGEPGVRIALDDVQEVRVRHVKGLETGLLAAGVAVVAITAIGVASVWISGWPPSF